MKIIDLNKRVFKCRNEEQITVEVLSKNTAHLVNYRLDLSVGHLDPGKPLIFKLDQSEVDPSFLTMGLHFSGTAKGVYAITIKGDASGDTFQDLYRQNHVPVLFDHFTFDIWS